MIQIVYDEDCAPLPNEAETIIKEKIGAILIALNKDEQALSIYFCSSTSIRELNQLYRNKDKETDILSWAYDDGVDEEEFPENNMWGELALCLEVCQAQADQANWDLTVELLRLLVHGLAHLVGYDHETSPEDEKQMLKFEKELLSSIDLNSVYQ